MTDKFTLSAFADEAHPMIDRQIEAMKRNGIKFVEIRGVDGVNISKISAEKASEVKKSFDENNIKVWSIGSPSGKISIKADFAPHFDEFCRMLETAKILGAKHFRMFSFYETDGDISHETEVLARLSKFAEKAKQMGIVLCHENEKGIYGDNIQRCLAIHKALPEIRAVFDPANFVQCGINPLEAWEVLSPYTEYVHIKDALKNGEIVPAGEGAGGVAEILKKLLEKGNTTLTLEPHLFDFSGLSELEENGGEQQKKQKYVSGDAAFDVAAKALKNIINTL